ncbi:hypothetical protein PR048_023202 [Dryococelus australis]|uniref:Uncharacterized protein n=1 Tax=Dryococelus australis TaxID=614101 RepID=A0ABQ9GTG2_9NEOP|nr:hypothetical protein PR048_023202 [Dryococelus australis]
MGWFMWREYLFQENSEQFLLPADRGGLGLVDQKLEARALFEKTTKQQFTFENRDVTALHRAVWRNDHILPRHYLRALQALKQTLIELLAGHFIGLPAVYIPIPYGPGVDVAVAADDIREEALCFLDLTAFPTVRRRAMVCLLMNLIDFTVNTPTPFHLREFVDRLRRARWLMVKDKTLNKRYGHYLFFF